MSKEKNECVSHNDSVNPVGGEDEISTKTDDANSGSTHCYANFPAWVNAIKSLGPKESWLYSSFESEGQDVCVYIEDVLRLVRPEDIVPIQFVERCINEGLLVGDSQYKLPKQLWFRHRDLMKIDALYLEAKDV